MAEPRTDRAEKPKAKPASRTLADLSMASAVAAAQPTTTQAAPERDKFGRSYATGKRKNAVARVWLKAGSGKMIVNGKELNAYFARPALRMIINQPFSVAARVGQFDLWCTVSGVGL